MNLDLNTLLYVSTAGAFLGAAVLSFFGAVQGTHPGFRWWVTAQWLVFGALLASALLPAETHALAMVSLGILQWPVLVLAGMRRLHPRKPPAIPAWADFSVLVFGIGLNVTVWAADAGPAARAAAFTLAVFGVNLYAAVVTTQLGGFKHSFALKSLVGVAATTMAVQAVCFACARLEIGGPLGLALLQLAAQVALAIPVLALVPIALALTYERTVAKMRTTHRKLRHLADVDVLTRLPNRRHFHDLATQALATTDAAMASVLMFDVENLKRINDLLGPSSGDEALRQVGLALRETLRSRDVSGRIGGDEFAAFLPDTSVNDAVRVAARITRHLEDRQVAPKTARLTLNVGAVQMHAGDSIVDVLRRADVALDDARGVNRGRVSGSARLEGTGAEPANAGTSAAASRRGGGSGLGLFGPIGNDRETEAGPEFICAELVCPDPELLAPMSVEEVSYESSGFDQVSTTAAAKTL